jgi:hypothetical protein
MPGTLHIQIGPSESLRISAEENLLPYIRTDARAGELDIHTESNVNVRLTRPIDYYLTVASLDTIRISSSGDVEAPALMATHFDVGISSSGSLAIERLQAETLRVDLSSSGSLVILGGIGGEAGHQHQQLGRVRGQGSRIAASHSPAVEQRRGHAAPRREPAG